MAEKNDVSGRRRPRERAADREARIVREAIRLFAEKGFQGGTRELARHVGIAHSVLFRHFATKDALLDRVYLEIYLSKWDPRWEALLKDRSRPLSERLLVFYRGYTAVIFNPEWIRIFMFAGMKSLDINARYFALLREHILMPILLELRIEQGAPQPQGNHVSAADLERAWGLHGKIFYLAIRELIYGISVLVPLETCVEDAIGVFIAGTPDIVEQSSPLETSAMAVPKRRRATSETPAYRMSPAARERSIVTGAIKFFAEYGTDGELRKLARSLGITHPLLYRYFPTKETLLEQVYDEVYAHRWNADWNPMLRDRSQPLAARLIRFYQAYLSVIDDREWMRIFIFSGLSGAAIHRNYLDIIRLKFVEPVAEELLISLHNPKMCEFHVTDREREVVWGLHGQIFYHVMRKWIYGIVPKVDPERLVIAAVTDFVAGATITLKKLSRSRALHSDITEAVKRSNPLGSIV